MSETKDKIETTVGNTLTRSGILLITGLFLLLSYRPVQAESLKFIQKVRVGLHRHSVRVVLILDRRPSRPILLKATTATPSIILDNVMPGTEVHRSLFVKTPSFKKYLSEIKISYNPEKRTTQLLMRFVHPVAPPSLLILDRPHRLVMDYKINGPDSSSSTGEKPAKVAKSPRKIVIPGKELPSPIPAPHESQASHPASAGTPSTPDKRHPQILSTDFSDPVHRFRVVLDAGHGGKDCGTMSVSGICEKLLVLDIVKRIQRILEQDPRFQVILTRNDDRFIPLPERTRIANESHGDLFLSVHANADPDPGVRGLETFLLNLHSSDARAQRIAQRENSALGVSQGDLSAILLTLKINHKKKRSWELAQEINDNLGRTLQASYPVRILGIRQAPFYVIMGTTMPAVLTEVNFLSNRTDARLMDSQQFRQETARALYKGIVAYYLNVHPESRTPRVTARLVHQEILSSEP